MAPTRPCIFFQQGRCRNGDGCTYSHIAAPATAVPPSAAATPTPIRQRPAGAVVRQSAHLAHLALREGGVGRAGTDLRTVGAAAPGVERGWWSRRTTAAGPGLVRLVPCRFFQMGHCRRGECCEFSHVTASTLTAIPWEQWNRERLLRAWCRRYAPCALISLVMI
ncbi:hypothetical protein BZA05DRAFT_408164 [Tricharina praecox]|uniref:uncharacterized protein n=1 Tax=Tricharina praecox TaxID=43433 RepID=UPI0022204866|nr:uncharacterized protein BZA05DRAFT_408164 [Tricharina praecox]KAI5845347.1 hypothetical protein BZA05DRAFT_408164 [Tricharina praecox]